MASLTISQSEILDALRSASEPLAENDAPSMSQLAELLGIGEQAAYARVRKLFSAGLIECVWVQRRGMDGIVRPRPGYRLIKKSA